MGKETVVADDSEDGDIVKVNAFMDGGEDMDDIKVLSSHS
jgi:hypothetical protein